MSNFRIFGYLYLIWVIIVILVYSALVVYLSLLININMIDLHARKLKDIDGNDMILLPESEFDALIKQIEDMEDMEAYLQAKKEDDGEHISIEEFIKTIKIDE